MPRDRRDPRSWPGPILVERGEEIELRLIDPARAGCSLRILDATGGLVRRLPPAGKEDGAARWSWNGREDAGREVSAGLYFVMVAAEGSRSAARILKLDQLAPGGDPAQPFGEGEDFATAYRPGIAPCCVEAAHLLRILLMRPRRDDWRQPEFDGGEDAAWQ